MLSSGSMNSASSGGGNGFGSSSTVVRAGAVETTPGSQLNDSKLSISTLEKQYAAPLGQRLMMGIQIDAQCLEGGFDAISKRARQNLNTTMGNNTMNANINVGGSAAFAGESTDFNSPNNTGSSNTDPNGVGDAFAFLNDDTPANNMPPPSSSSNNRKGFGGFLKKVAARTTDTLERGMQGLAVRMDQGKNADLVRVGIYDPTTNELLGVTESLPVPGTGSSNPNNINSNSSNNDVNNTQQQQQQNDPKHIRFEVPVWIPGSRRQNSLLLKVWIQSGATLVLQSAKTSKNYLIGSSIINCQVLSEGVTAVALSMTLPQQQPYQSQQRQPPQLQLCILPDPKFSPILTRGWSLTDPEMSGYSSTLNYLPLDQSYVFPGKQPNHWLIAHERATESTIPLPIAAAVTQLAANACDKSLEHAKSVARILRNNRHDYKDPINKATCDLGLVGVVPLPNRHGNTNYATAATISLAWRRPDSMFEFEIAVNESIPVVPTNGPTPGGHVSVRRTFHPKVCFPDRGDHILPGILQAYGGKIPSSGLLGGIYFSVAIQTTGCGGNDPTTPDGAPVIELWETVLGLEAFVNNSSTDGKSKPSTIQVPLRKGKDDVGQLLLQIQVTLPQQPANGKKYMETLPAADGLVSLVGMDSLSDGVKPYLDSMPPAIAPSLRHQQLNTMGYFFTTQYMEQHLALRQSACDSFKERARRYKQALSQPEKDAPPHTLKTPKNFRPSSSRTTTLLSGIPFNCHIASLNINVMDAIHPKATSSSAAAAVEYPGASFHNITCGAPSDHARGFGNILTNVSHKNISGGLRRLEAQRLECASQLQQVQSMLIAGVGQYLTEARKTGPVNHVPARHAEIQQLRWRVFECVHNLHHVTWMCAVRRANVFSQSLGLALSSFLASLSDRNKCAAGWPDLWTKHGFLVCFEGLLSAAGKELGMIEDASVAIAMLRMVHVVLVSDSGIPTGAVKVQSSPYLRWVYITASGGEGSARKFVVQIGIDRGYYLERIPVPLRNNTSVRLYPILFEVGVDIRQAGSNLIKNNQNNQSSGGGIVDDGDEDDVGVIDDDVLVALNYEAMQKMNCYAHALSPQQIPLDKVHAAMERVFSPNKTITNINTLDRDQLPVHPSLAQLNSHIMSSFGKMNHSILDEAATIAQQLGGGGVVFCKSGKDRTAMHLTYKQCQFAARYRGNSDKQAILRDAHLLRLHGTRLPVCEKNVGQALYAFNSLQVKFMPEALKPPMESLAGFLKGGEIFKGGGIES